MQKNTAQLDIFDTQADTSLPPLASAPLAGEPDPTGSTLKCDDPPRLCLFPSAGIQECRECWERHPELWARYITRANCVRHTR
jgi:hypothetical protein